ncbi:MAG: hypothetical protein AAGC79_11325 [Pseudomonadota bacterium]
MAFRTLFGAVAIALTLAPGAQADEITDTIQAALEAYEAGDIKLAKEELDFASQLLSQIKATGLTAFLPEPMDGWTQQEVDTQASAALAFGGGLVANAVYENGGKSVDMTLMADSPMVTAMAAALGNVAIMGSMGQVKRVNGQRLVVTPDGEIQSLIDGKVLVQISGTAAVEEKLAYFEALDAEGLADF